MSWDTWTTTPTPTQAHAFLGVLGGAHHTFRLNPDQVSWDYAENVFSQDTLGGRVVQLLSVSLNGITVTGRAGNRGELQRMAQNIKSIMNYHVRTLNAVSFKVPSRNWNFKVYVKDMPTMTWDVAATSYPYQLNMLVEEDLNGIKTKEINKQVLQRLASGIGYDHNRDIHGGDANLLKRQYEIVTANQTGTTPTGEASSNITATGAPIDLPAGSKVGPKWAQAVFNQIKKQVPGVQFWGINSCRHIAGSSTWSQHSWGNAVDIGVSTAEGDAVNAWANQHKSEINAEHILWKVADHYDHVHIDFAPNFPGTPPCAGG